MNFFPVSDIRSQLAKFAETVRVWGLNPRPEPESRLCVCVHEGTCLQRWRRITSNSRRILQNGTERGGWSCGLKCGELVQLLLKVKVSSSSHEFVFPLNELLHFLGFVFTLENISPKMCRTFSSSYGQICIWIRFYIMWSTLLLEKLIYI